jgi:hypothetical protein
MAQIEVKVKLDLPVGVELLGYERCGDGHGFEVRFPLPLYCRREKCGTKEPATYEYKNTVYVVRNLDLWGQPSFWIFQPRFHRCSRCGHRQEHFASFKRKKVMYTYRFEEYVLRMLIGSNEEEVAQRLGISAGTVALMVENQLKHDKQIDPARVIKHVGFDEISLKKQHKLYVTLMTDLTDPESPKVLAVARGRDTVAEIWRPSTVPPSISPSAWPSPMSQTARVAKTPVRRAPKVPPTPCTPKASSESPPRYNTSQGRAAVRAPGYRKPTPTAHSGGNSAARYRCATGRLRGGALALPMGRTLA